MKLLISILFIGGVFMADAQQMPKWIKDIGIRQSFDDDESKQKPALFTMTIPKEKDPSYLVDLGLKYNFSTLGKQTQHSIIGEYHANTLADAEVNNVQLGYKLMHIFKKPTPPEDVYDLLDPNYIQTYKTLKINATAKYRYDKIEGSHGMAVSAIFNYFQQGPKSTLKTRWSSWNSNRDSNFAYLLVPQFGFEVQQNFKADSTLYTGFVGRSIVGISVSFGSIYKNKKNPYVPLNKWLFTLDATLRYDVVGKEYTDSRWHPMIKANLDFFLVPAPIKIIFGPSFTYGDNPVEGFREFKFKEQQFWAFTIKIQK